MALSDPGITSANTGSDEAITQATGTVFHFVTFVFSFAIVGNFHELGSLLQRSLYAVDNHDIGGAFGE